jgi:hypothetical protein
MMVPIRTRVEQGRYEVDARRVADAILARLLASAGPIPGAVRTHRECSKPVSLPSASTKTASA